MRSSAAWKAVLIAAVGLSISALIVRSTAAQVTSAPELESLPVSSRLAGPHVEQPSNSPTRPADWRYGTEGWRPWSPPGSRRYGNGFRRDHDWRRDARRWQQREWQPGRSYGWQRQPPWRSYRNEDWRYERWSGPPRTTPPNWRREPWRSWQAQRDWRHAPAMRL